ncbi:MAG: deoxyribonuclease IV [Phycisphaeraceae bacterium]|nr:MAG: deoxyribonuclease IV [Phycisphaeraceae bacterium]
MFGSHLSIAGSMVNALREGERLGMDCVQVFTKNQQQWKAKPLDPAMVEEWRSEVGRLGWDLGGPPDAKGSRRGGITSHASYLINLASPDDGLHRKSIDLMTDEVERCETLGIPFLVHHPGAFTAGTLEGGIARIASAYREVFRRTRGVAVVSCLEGTVGAGSQIGGRFEELAAARAAIIDATGEPSRVGYCLDTCHMHAAGYDLSTAGAAHDALETFDRVCGLAHLRVFHINDSKGKAGSRLDRHEHIGEGTIGGGTLGHPASPAALRRSGFMAVVNHPVLTDVPKILETPKGELRGVPLDSLNLSRLKDLCNRPGPRGAAPPAVSPGTLKARSSGAVRGAVVGAKSTRARIARAKVQESRPAGRKTRGRSARG